MKFEFRVIKLWWHSFDARGGNWSENFSTTINRRRTFLTSCWFHISSEQKITISPFFYIRLLPTCCPGHVLKVISFIVFRSLPPYSCWDSLEVDSFSGEMRFEWSLEGGSEGRFIYDVIKRFGIELEMLMLELLFNDHLRTASNCDKPLPCPHYQRSLHLLNTCKLVADVSVQVHRP